MLLGSSATAGLGNNGRNSKRGQVKSTAGMSVLGFSKKRKGDPSRKHNIDKIKGMSSRSLPEEFHYKPKVSQSFLENWLDFPVDRNVSVIFNSFKMWLVWLVWTNQGMAGLDPTDTTIRARICSQLSVLGTAAGLLLVIAITGFLVPPEIKTEDDKVWLDVFGILMFTASVSLIFYIGVALTAFYPMVESLRDDIAFDAFENYQNRIGGCEVYLFYVGMQLVLAALFVAAKIIYSDQAIYVMLGVSVPIMAAVTHLSRQIFLALDPISAMHMGLSNDPEEQYRAELLSHFILRKIPNTLLESDTGGEIFQQKHESVKYEQAKKAREEPEPEPEPEHGGFSPREEDAVHAFSEGESLARVPFAAQSEDAWAQKEGSKAGEAAGRVSGGQGLWQQAKVAPLAADQAMGVEDFESAALPVVNKPKAHSSAPSSAVFSPAGGFDRDTASALPPLNELFCDPEMYRFRTMGLSLADSIAAHACLVRAGCTSTEELVAYLDDHKQSQRLCACRPLGSSTESNKSEQAHEAQCSTRQAGAWTPALTTTGIPAFHARKIIVSLKAFLA